MSSDHGTATVQRDPAALVAGLWRSSLSRGARIHAPTKVVDIDPGRAHVTLDGRVIVGGEDEEFSDEDKRDALIRKKIAAICRKLEKLVPARDTRPEFTWAGCFGASPTGLPGIGEIPGAERCYAVLGYGGNGITFSAIAAQIIQRAILGLRDPDADLFALPT